MLLVLGVHGAGFWRRPCAQDVGALGLHFYVCLFIGRKVTMDFISFTFKFVIKCQFCQLSKQATICSCCFSESRDSPTVSLLSSTCLLPLTALCSLWEGGYSYASSPSQGLSAPGLTTMAYPGSRGLAWSQ